MRGLSRRMTPKAAATPVVMKRKMIREGSTAEPPAAVHSAAVRDQQLLSMIYPGELRPLYGYHESWIP